MKILLTAPPAVGKSTVIAKVIEGYPGRSRGIVAREMLDASGLRCGFKSINSSGESRQFMFLESDPAKAVIGGEYSVDVGAVDDFVVSELQTGRLDKTALLYVDEIGRAQALSAKFLEELRRILNSNQNVLASVVYDDEPWAREFKQHADVCLVTVNWANRKHLPELLAKAFHCSHKFQKLSKAQKERAFQYFVDCLDSLAFDSAGKLFTNAVGYVIDREIEIVDVVKNESGDVLANVYSIHGQTKTHKLTKYASDDKVICDCDLSNGLGDFAGKPAICSHEMSVVLFALE